MVQRIRWAFREKMEKWWWSKSKLCAITISTEVHWFMDAAVKFAKKRPISIFICDPRVDPATGDNNTRVPAQ